jgi:hypothetical protein
MCEARFPVVPDGLKLKLEHEVVQHGADPTRPLEELLQFIEEKNIKDEGADDGDEHYDTWRSAEFEHLIATAKASLQILKEGLHAR